MILFAIVAPPFAALLITQGLSMQETSPGLRRSVAEQEHHLPTTPPMPKLAEPNFL